MCPSIFVACPGLFGLVAFSAEQRTKEVGVRKVLGATVTSLIVLLSKDFVKLVRIANLIAWPVAGYALNRWLEDFAYQIDISWRVFTLAGDLALIIAQQTVSTHGVKAALANPLDNLRNEPAQRAPTGGSCARRPYQNCYPVIILFEPSQTCD